MKWISKDLYIDTTGKGTLKRIGLNESKHLLWRMGGVPCLRKIMWDKYRDYVNAIEVHTDKHIFWISKSDFDNNKMLITNGREKQWTVERSKWWVEKSKQEQLL